MTTNTDIQEQRRAAIARLNARQQQCNRFTNIGEREIAREMKRLSVPSEPTIGQLVTVRGVQCRIVKVRPMGTIDVVALDGSRAWRVSGLAFN